jgi:hypothetical protein
MALPELYRNLNLLANADLSSAATNAALRELISEALDRVVAAQSVELISKVPGKEYYMAAANGRTSRAINKALFQPTVPRDELFATIFNTAPPYDAAKLDMYLYTAGMSFPVARDLVMDGDKKSPGTFFECLIGHIVAARYGINPKKQILIPTLDEQVMIPTDFIFELGQNRRIHLPIKLSTRERVVQVWAHQKLLDGMHGANRFKGVLICLTETNKQKNVSVVEVCLPNQWRAYQMYIAQLDRVYYLDLPQKYANLRNTYPHIQVWPLSTFFAEADTLFNLANAV